jgi:hypothetical protein
LTAEQAIHSKARFFRSSAWMAWAVCLAACASSMVDISSGAFRNAGMLETQLHRGISTKADVRTLLGVPNGPGSWLLPALDPAPREIWYYEDMSQTGGTLRVQMILVFFKGNVYDGYLWTSG